MNRPYAPSFDPFDRRFRNRVCVFAKIVFDMVFGLANLVRPDGTSILEMNDVGGRRQRREKH